MVHPKVKENTKKEKYKQTQPSRAAAGCSNQRLDSDERELKFYYVKSTEETKIPLRNAPENFNTKIRRSSRICKHKPGVKHYCRHRNWDQIVSKDKTEVLDNPLIDLGTFCKTKFQSTNKELLMGKQINIKNVAEEPLVLTCYKEHSPQQMNSNNKGTFSTSKYSGCNKIVQDATCTSSDANSNNLGLQNGKEMGDQSLFHENFGLMRKVSQREVVNCNDLKLLNAETSNNAEAENTANIDIISGGSDPEAHSIDVVEETTNEMGPDISSESTNLEEVKDKSFQELTEDHDSANPENIEHSQEENTSSEKNTEYLNDQSTPYESGPTNQINGDGAHEKIVSSSPQECSCHSERLSYQVKPTNETHKSLHSPVGVNNFLVDNVLRNRSLNVTSCPPVHSSINVKCETRGHTTNNHEQETNNISNYYVISSFPGPFPRNPVSQTCASRPMYSSAGGVNGVFLNFYGSPCLPTPILATPVVSPVFAYNIPMNNVMCASHPSFMPFPNNGGYVPTSLDCTSQQSFHHSLPLSFNSVQSNPSNILYHNPGLHQWVNVNTSAIVPCWTQSRPTYISGTHLPSCGGSSHAPEPRSQLQFNFGYYPSDS